MHNFQPGVKLEINVVHYAPDHKNKSHNKSEIWVVSKIKNELEEGMTICAGHGYVLNVFGEDYFGNAENFRKETFDATIKSVSYFEHCNGGRQNTKAYQSVEEYLSDPVVKENLRRKSIATVFDMSPGDPERIDVEIVFTFDKFPNVELMVTETSYEDIVPEEWYSEFYAKEINELETFDVFENAQEAIINTKIEEDIFGQRAFPVMRVPHNASKELIDCHYAFKNYSKPLKGKEFIYFGLRSKMSELDTINEIYELGGHILKNKQWDWA